MITIRSSDSLLLTPASGGLSPGAENPDADGWTPLHHAAARDDTVQTTQLLSQGLDPAAVTRAGATPLILACWLGHTATASAILADERTDVNLGDRSVTPV
jgi:ankyrin repeat protein